MKQETRIWYLMAQKLSQEISAEELSELQGALQENQELNYNMHVLADLWKHHEKPDREDIALAIDRLQEQIRRRSDRVITWKKRDTKPNFLQRTLRMRY